MIKKVFIFLIFLIQTIHLDSREPKLEEVISGMDSPWSLSFISKNKIIISEKPGNLMIVNLEDKKIKRVNHNLKILEDGQGGLLEVLYYE